MNIEQEIWTDFQSLTGSSLMDRLSYNDANAKFGVSFDDRNSLIHNGIYKKLEHDEDYILNKFLSNSDYKNVNWDDLQKLYPYRFTQKTEFKKEYIVLNKVKFRTNNERREINNILLDDWEDKKIKLYNKIPNEKYAKEYLMSIRWDNQIPICPKCGHEKTYILNEDRFKCASSKCYAKFSVKFGTIFQYSNLPLLKWYEVMYLLTALKTRKISTYQLSAATGIAQKNTWSMSVKIQSKINDEFISKIKQGLFEK